MSPGSAFSARAIAPEKIQGCCWRMGFSRPALMTMVLLGMYARLFCADAEAMIINDYLPLVTCGS
jgi:hypothetical protein